MIEASKEAEISRLFHAEKWPVGTIANELGVHHSVVKRVLSNAGASVGRSIRPSMMDPYLPFIRETLEKHPHLRANRLFDMCVARGYGGVPDHFRHRLSSLRPRRAAEAFLRLPALPAQEAQVDWGHFGRIIIGGANRSSWPLSWCSPGRA